LSEGIIGRTLEPTKEDPSMPRYVIQRRFDVGSDQMPEIGRRSRQIIENEFPNVVWVHSHIAVEEDGNVRTFCLYDAPDLEAIKQHAEMLGYHQVDGVYEVAGDVTPADFPPLPETN
jgi:hypothetical protein